MLLFSFLLSLFHSLAGLKLARAEGGLLANVHRHCMLPSQSAIQPASQGQAAGLRLRGARCSLTIHGSVVTNALEEPVNGCLGPRAVSDALKGGCLSDDKRLLAHLLERYLLRFDWRCEKRLRDELAPRR